jgi:hypothetical protein
LLRFFATFLIAAMTLPSIALISATARTSCCCKSSGACPLRKHAGCAKVCSMTSSDAALASSFRAPDLARDPAVFLVAAFSFPKTSTDFAVTFTAAPLHRATPPALPPPRA